MKKIFLIALGVWSICQESKACCAAGPLNQPVVNADQTVAILWNPETKVQHFIRQASFASESSDIGFIIPTPTQPELEEAGDAGFAYLAKLTTPEVVKKRHPSVGIGCAAPSKGAITRSVTVLEEKRVAGFDAAVLEATSSASLAQWLRQRNYHLSLEIENWARPYVRDGWKFTALKIAAEDPQDTAEKELHAAALRLSFQTDQPLFPYREPKSDTAAAKLNASPRLLRLFVISDGRYEGLLGTDSRPWKQHIAWSGPLTTQQHRHLIERFGLTSQDAEREWWLTEIEHQWPYSLAPGEVYFSKSAKQETVKRPPTTVYVASLWGSPLLLVILGLAIGFLMWGWIRYTNHA